MSSKTIAQARGGRSTDDMAGRQSRPKNAENGKTVRESVAQFTRKLFNGDVQIRRESDPEFSSDYFVVSVITKGSLQELLTRNHKWHRDIGKIAGESADQYRLSLTLR